MAEPRRRGTRSFSHFGDEANLFAELEKLFRDYAETGQGTARKYLHNDEEAAPYKQPPGTFTAWEPLPDSELLFYEGLHGAVVTARRNVAQHPDLLDRRRAGHQPRVDPEDPSRPQHARLLHRGGDRCDPPPHARLRALHRARSSSAPHVNFQRVPVVDTSNPFIARTIPTADESLVVIRFAQSARHRLPVPAEHAARLVDVARQHDRLPRR